MKLLPLAVVAEGLACVAAAALAAKSVGLAPFLDVTDTQLSLRDIPRTFARTLVVPGLVEEAFWRGLLVGPTARTLSPRSLAVNAAYAAAHVPAGQLLAPLRPGAPALFQEPGFLALAVVLGLACTRASRRAGLAAPVLVHAVTVTTWLTLLQGDRMLREGPTTTTRAPHGSR
mmetsp:Transcript_905/g.2559  ORF Transcript_905/g.2559 Transcript_905/m.2559 type:complete len:173 (-) Transcript_905:1087-1605(-)